MKFSDFLMIIVDSRIKSKKKIFYFESINLNLGQLKPSLWSFSLYLISPGFKQTNQHTNIKAKSIQIEEFKMELNPLPNNMFSHGVIF